MKEICHSSRETPFRWKGKQRARWAPPPIHLRKKKERSLSEEKKEKSNNFYRPSRKGESF